MRFLRFTTFSFTFPSPKHVENNNSVVPDDLSSVGNRVPKMNQATTMIVIDALAETNAIAFAEFSTGEHFGQKHVYKQWLVDAALYVILAK